MGASRRIVKRKVLAMTGTSKMTAGQLVERLQQLDPATEVELIVWNMYDQRSPGLHCTAPGLGYGDGVVWLQGPGEEEEMLDEDESEDDAGDEE